MSFTFSKSPEKIQFLSEILGGNTTSPRERLHCLFTRLVEETSCHDYYLGAEYFELARIEGDDTRPTVVLSRMPDYGNLYKRLSEKTGVSIREETDEDYSGRLFELLGGIASNFKMNSDVDIGALDCDFSNS